MSRPIKNREQFFKLVEEGLQQYFDGHDKYWGGILHLTVGVKTGKVGGIIKAESMLSYEGFTLCRVAEILKYVLPKHMTRTGVRFAVDEVISELRMGGTPPEAPEEAPEDTPAPAEDTPTPAEDTPAPTEEAPKKRRGRKPKAQVEPTDTENV